MNTDLLNLDWEPFVQFGLAGLILGVFFVLLVFIMKQHAKVVQGIVGRMSTDHKESNDAWRFAFSDHSKQADTRQAETNEVLRDLTKVMAENNVCISDLKRGKHYGEQRRTAQRTNA